MDKIRAEMTAYYNTICWHMANWRPDQESIPPLLENQVYQKRLKTIYGAMDKIYEENPETDALLLKSKLYETIVEHFEPVIFPHCPFFFEMGIRPSENWGTPSNNSAATWLWQKRHEDFVVNTPEWQNVRKIQASYNGEENNVKLWQFNDAFDADHHCLNYTRLLKEGLKGIIEQLKERSNDTSLSERQHLFLKSALIGCEALIAISKKFSSKARQMLEVNEYDQEATRFLTMIAESAGHVPANPPRNFYEGLASMLFLREASASLESIGISVLGHADRLLGDLYRQDLENGAITEEEASDLIYRWMLMTDIKFHIEDNKWPETSTCVELGGCDETGAPVYNKVTELFLKTHAKHHLLNPKLNCRYGSNSPDEYLELMGELMAEGHNNFAFLNDDVLIPANVKKGKTVEQARLYVNGGCQETMVEGVEHSAGACYYFNMARAFDLFMQERVDYPFMSANASMSKSQTFDEFKNNFLEALGNDIATGAKWAAAAGRNYRHINPCPLFSTSLKGTIENAADYTEGSAIFNPATVAAIGFANVADSLLAIKKIVYDEKLMSLTEFQAMLSKNWEGNENLRMKCLNLPKFGHGNAEADEIAGEFADRLADIVDAQVNERGGQYQGSFFVYYAFVHQGKNVGATPDGRSAGEMLAQGVAPSRQNPPKNLTDVFDSNKRIDFTRYPANAVLDITLPATLSKENFRSLLRGFARTGGATLQANCVSKKDLEDAQTNPQAHLGLTVRISGLSARFVCLMKDVQDEIISRATYAA